jgi:large subunit ribosomal protein L25
MELKAIKRDVVGKKVKAIRDKGLVPAELFGKGLPNEHLAVTQKDFTKAYKAAGAHELVTLAVEGGKKTQVLITDAHRDAISGEYLAADFYAVRMDEKIKVKIPMVFFGEAPAIKLGLPVIKVIDEIEIETLPGKMPHEFKIDVSSLDGPHKSIHVKDIKAIAEFKTFVSPESVIVTVGEKTKAEAVVAAPVAEAATPAADTAAPAAEAK